MDPFSAAASALGVADVCFRLGKSINNYVKKFVHIDELLLNLQVDIESLAKVCTAIKEVYDHASEPISFPTPPQSPQSPALSEALAAEPGFTSEGSGHERVAYAPSPLPPPKSAATPTGGFPPSLANLNDIIKADLNSCKTLVEEMEKLVEAIVIGANDDKTEKNHLSTETSSGVDEMAAETAQYPAVGAAHGKGRNAVARNLEWAKTRYTRLHDKKTKLSHYINIEHEIERMKVQISAYRQEMTIMLQIINYFYAASAGERTAVSVENVGAMIKNFGQHFSEELDALRQERLQSRHERDQNQGQKQYLESLSAVHDSLKLGLATMKEPRESLFDIPQAVSQNYTGRKQLLVDLASDLLPSAHYTPPNGQRVFVIHGLGGSGKTQFCCKFAYDNRYKVWGVLWVDASSERKLKRSLIDLFVKYGDGSRDHSDVSQALDWFSNLQHTWLLIIDNADQPNLNIAHYIPKSSKGCVLITTKSKAHISLGTVGQQYYSFSGLEKDEATELLLKTSLDRSQNWSDFRAMAENVAAELGYLALAIVHAGTAIKQELCTFARYIDYFEITCKQIREQARSVRTARSNGFFSDEAGSDDSDYDGDFDTERDLPIFATWETCYQRLAMKIAKQEQSAVDAMQLLEIFAFLDRRRFSKEILKRAIRNSAIEKEADKANAKEAGNTKPTGPHGHLTAWLGHIGSRLAMALLRHIRQGGEKLLPLLVSELRRYSRDSSMLDKRIDKAFWELSQMALIGKNEREDTYFMHPVVHTWARERLTLSHQALIVEMASSLLSASVLLPPHDCRPEDNIYHISLLPHVEYVTKNKAVIAMRILNKREERQLYGTAIFDRIYNLAETPDVDGIRMQAKFGVIYAKSGLLDKASERLQTVQEAIYRHRGKESREARRVDLSLSDIYFALGQAPKARDLLQDLLARCEKSLGKHHEDTYRIMGKLGRVLWMLGLFSEAVKVQTAAVKGLEETLGKDAVDTLEVVDHLGSTVMKFWKPEDHIRAYGLHKRVVDTLSRKREYGENHERVLFATENMCRVAIFIKRRDNGSSSSSESGQAEDTTPPSPVDPFASAPVGLGAFNPQDPDATGDAIAASAGTGRVTPEPAEKVVPMMERVLRVREKTLGKKHPFTLLAMVNYAITKMAVGDFAEAEQILRNGLDIAYTILPSKHIGILFGRQTLACVLRERGDYLEAGKILKQVSQYQEEMWPSRERLHPDRLATLSELSHCYLLAGEIDLSIKYIAMALDGFSTVTDENHPIMVWTRETHKQLMLVKKCRMDGVPEPEVCFPQYLYKP